MKRSEQARMFIGLAIPGSGPVAAPRTRGSPERRSFALRGMLTEVQSWSRRHGIEGFQVAYFCILLGCGVLFGLFVGGYVGYMENATPHAGLPNSLAHLATSDPQWAAKVRQDWPASHQPESAGRHVRQTHWQYLISSATTHSGSDVPGGAPSSVSRSGHFVRFDVPSADSAPHHPNHEVD